jgi:hypothetical protein
MSYSAARVTLCGVLLALVMTACTRQPQSATIEEITFQSGEFTLVGDLRLPKGTGPFPVVLYVHGDAPGADRTFFGMYLPIMERMLRAGYAVFSWDNPGAGESTGATSSDGRTQQHAQIVLDAIEVMKANPDIVPGRIGLWGVSMAGWVMPRVLMASDDVAFMICQSCGSMSGIDEFVYLTVAQGYCGGVPDEDADRLEILLAEFAEARTYDTYEGYLHYRQVLDDLAALRSATVAAPVVPEAAWMANDPAYGSWSPVHVFEQVRIPVLAIWGERDTKVDPIRAAHAYRDALEQAGNLSYRIEIIPGVDHTLAPSETGCISEEGQTLERVLKEQGYGPLEESLALVQQEPGQHTPLSAWPYAPEYLDMIEEWLRGLPS